MLDDAEEGVPDLRAMVSPFAEVTVFGIARVVTSRARLADRRVSTDEPEGSPARPAASGAYTRHDACGEKPDAYVERHGRAAKPVVAIERPIKFRGNQSADANGDKRDT